MSHLLNALKGCRSPTLVVVLAAYPRWQTTGLLSEIGTAIDLATASLMSEGAHVERVLHSMIVALLTEEATSQDAVALASKNASSDLIEVRTIMVSIATERSEEWMDELIGDVTKKENFQSFALDEAFRMIDGHPITHTLP